MVRIHFDSHSCAIKERERSSKQSIGTIILSGLIALIFIAAGGSKLLNPQPHIERFTQCGYPDWFLYMTGAIEIIGGIFVLVPSVQFLGGILLTCTMIGAFLTHVRAGELGALPVPFVIGTLTGVLVWISRPLRKA